MTDTEKLQDIKEMYQERDRPYPGMAWLIQRVEQLEKEVQNLRDALASS